MKKIIKKTIPLDVITTAQRLVENDSIVIAGYFMLTYFKRCWKVDEELAKVYVTKWFERNYPSQLHKHKSRIRRKQEKLLKKS